MYKGYKLPEKSDCEITIEEYVPSSVQITSERILARIEEIRDIANVSETRYLNQ